MRILRMTALATLLLAVCSPAWSQSKPEPHFEVASVNPRDKNNLFGKPRSITGTLAKFEGDSIASLLIYAFDVPVYRIVAPGWVLTGRYDITGRLPESASLADVPLMVRSLLGDRFHLRFHWETRTEDVFVLSMEKALSHLEPAQPDEVKFTHGDYVFGKIEFGRTSMAGLATELSLCCSNRQVVDETNVAGEFDLKLVIGRDGFKTLPLPPREGEPQHSYDEGAWRSAIQEYGLRARPARRGVQYLVIDHIDEAPTPN